MMGAALPPLQPPIVPFGEFLAALFQALEGEGVRPCILRNYEGFPTNNIGNDVDFLIRPAELSRAIRALRSIRWIRIVGYTERPYVASVYLAGTSATPGGRSLHVDFDLSLSWKGLPFLPLDTVLQAAIPRRGGSLNFFVPDPVHEAIVSLLTSLLIAGWLKEKYFPQVQQTFAGERSKVIAALLPQFGLKAATRLADLVIDGDRRKVMACVPSLRTSLAQRSLLHRPFRSAQAVVRHCARELAECLSAESLETVCILGPGGGGKTTIIEGLIPILQSSAQVVEKCNLRQRLPYVRESSGRTTSADSHKQLLGGSLVSMAKVALWLLEERLRQFIEKQYLTLHICEGYYHDLKVDPQRYRYFGPIWFARLICKLIPSPDLWIMMDPPKDNLQTTNPEGQPAEIRRQLDVYRAFVKTRKRYVILDASQPADRVTERAYAAIIDTLAKRADKQLKRRFK
jgi:hypothetical protein